MDEAYLAHHGIKGQKWGIRRFQNADGTLTAEGKKRYSGNDEKMSWAKKHKKKLMIAGGVAAGAAASAGLTYFSYKYGKKTIQSIKSTNVGKEKLKNSIKNLSSLTDDELNILLSRLKKEDEVKNLYDKNYSNGKKFVEGLAKGVIGKAVGTIATGAMLYGAKAAVSKQFDPKEFGNAIYNGGPKKK